MKNVLIKRYAFLVFALALIITLSGCNRLSLNRTRIPRTQANAVYPTLMRPALHVAGQKLVLPGGKVITDFSALPVKWSDLRLQLVTYGVSASRPVQSALGNCSENVSQKQVSIPFGPGTLVLVKLEPSAAEQADSNGLAKSTLEYRLMVFRPYPSRPDMELAYTICARFSGSRRRAESELLAVTKGWQIGQRLVLPNGKIISEFAAVPAKWAGLRIQLRTYTVPSSPSVEVAIDAGSESVSQKQVSLPLGSGILALFKHGPSASGQAGSSGTAKSTYEYRLMVFRPYPPRPDMELAYTVCARFSGSRRQAESELLAVARGWEIP